MKGRPTVYIHFADKKWEGVKKKVQMSGLCCNGVTVTKVTEVTGI